MAFDMNWFRLDTVTAFVTGAGSGIGQGMAIGLARAGADVACFDLAESPGLGETVCEIQRLGRKALGLTGNVARAADLEDAIASVTSELGVLEVAINCAGIANATAAEDMPLEQWQHMVDVNFTGVFLSCQAEARAMLPERAVRSSTSARCPASSPIAGSSRRTTTVRRPPSST